MTWDDPQPAPPVDGDVTQFLMSGQKIAAIKLIRQRRHTGLKEAKDYVDAIEAGLDPALRAQLRTTSSNALARGCSTRSSWQPSSTPP